MIQTIHGTSALLKKYKTMSLKICINSFRVFDTDGNGRISKDELRKVNAQKHNFQK